MRGLPDDRNIAIIYRITISNYRICWICQSAALLEPRSVVVGAYPVREPMRSAPCRLALAIKFASVRRHLPGPQWDARQKIGAVVILLRSPCVPVIGIR